MTTVNTALARYCHPQRKPQVRSHTFIDGIGPPPWTFFDETQDHLGALFQAMLGWKASIDFDEFTTLYADGTNISQLTIYQQMGGAFAIAPLTSAELGEHGVWRITAGAAPWQVGARSAELDLRGDFLLTAKVRVRNRSHLDFSGLNGCCLAVGNRTRIPVCPGIACGSESPNWQVFFGTSPTSGTTYADSAIPVVDGMWYRLQISRLNGALRFHINGAQVQVNGDPGVDYPYVLTGCKFVYVSRWTAGGAGVDGIDIDAMHLLAERVLS